MYFLLKYTFLRRLQKAPRVNLLRNHCAEYLLRSWLLSQQVFILYHKHVILRHGCCIQEAVIALHKHILLMFLKEFNYECASCQRAHLRPGCRIVLGFSTLVATSHSRPCPGPGLWEECLGEPQLHWHEDRSYLLKCWCLVASNFLANSPVTVMNSPRAPY